MLLKSEKMLSRLVILLPLAILVLGTLTTIIYSQFYPSPRLPHNPQVLGYSDTRIFINGNNSGYDNFGVISQSMYATPQIYISVSSATDSATLKIYNSNADDLTNFLIHDETDQINPILETANKQLVLQKTLSKNDLEQNMHKVELPFNDQKGIWLIDVQYKNIRQQVILIRSGFGVYLSKTEKDYLFWAQDFNSGKSISDVKIRILSLKKELKILSDRSTNEQGIIGTEILPGADLAIAQKDDDYSLVPINLNHVNLSNYYESFQKSQKQKATFTFTDRPLYKPGDTIYFKSVIRDSLDKVYSIPSGTVTVSIAKSYPNQKTIYTQKILIDKNGEISGEYKLPEDITLGGYYLKMDFGDAEQYQDYYYYQDDVYFEVKYYRKPEYSLELITPKIELIRGETTQLNLKASYFSGEPVKNRQVKYKITSSNYYEYEYVYQNLFNDNFRYGTNYGKNIFEGTVNLNEKGEGKISLDTNLPDSESTAHLWSVEATLVDGSGKTAYASSNVLIRPAQWSIFRDYETSLAVLGQTREIPIRALMYKSGVGVQTQLLVKPQYSYWEKYQNAEDKYFRYREITTDLPEFKIDTYQNGNGRIRFTPINQGSYKFTVIGTDSQGNKIVKEFFTYASNFGWNSQKVQKRESLLISSNKSDFLPGETAKIFLNLENSQNRDVLITVNGLFTDRYALIKTTGSDGVYDLKITETDIPNRFITATAFSKEGIVTSTLEINISKESKKISVDIKPERTKIAPGQDLKFTIQTKDHLGDPVSSSVAFWGVDKALYELRESGPKYIFETFWNNRYLETRTANSLMGMGIESLTVEGGGCFTAETRVLLSDKSTKPIKDIQIGDKILTRRSQEDPQLVEARVKKIFEHKVHGYLIINGKTKVTPEHIMFVNKSWHTAGEIQVGNLLLNSAGKYETVKSIEWVNQIAQVYNLEIEKYNTFFADNLWVHNEKGGDSIRSDLKDTAYWNPSIQTDRNGQATVFVKMPENLTTWVFSAIAVNEKTQIGESTTEITATKDIIVRPIIPNLVRLGDKITLSSIVYNGTDKDRNFNVSLAYPAAQIKNSTQSAVIKAGDSVKINWDAEITHLDQQQLIVKAVSQDDSQLSDAISLPLPVEPYQVVYRSGETAIDNHIYTLSAYPDTDTKTSEVELTLSSTLNQSAKTAMNYLIDYPYGCTEQTTSRLVPIIIAKKYPQVFPEALSKHQDKINKMLVEGFKRLKINQSDGGGWAWWGNGPSDPFVTSYVTEYLILAEQAGISFDKNILDLAKQYFINLPSDTPINQVLKAYVASLYGGKTAPIEKQQLEKLPIDILSYAVLANLNLGVKDPSQNGLEQLRKKAIVQGDGLIFSNDIKQRFGSDLATTAIAYRALKQNSNYKQDALRSLIYISRNKKNDYWGNTFTNAQIIRAIAESEEPNLNINLNYQVLLDGKTISQGKINTSTESVPSIKINPADLTANSKLEIKKDGSGDLYSTLVYKNVRTSRDLPQINNGLKISRKFISEYGQNYSLGIGDLVTVELTVSGLEKAEDYAVIQDELPSGLSPVDESFDNEQSNYDYYPNYYDYYLEYTQNGIIASIDRLTPNDVITYKARVISAGEFIVPPARTSLMYAPEINALSTAEIIKTYPQAQKLYDLPVYQQNPVNLTPAGIKKILKGNRTTILNIFLSTGIIIASVIALYVLRKNNKKKISDSINTADHTDKSSVDKNKSGSTKQN